MAISDIVKKIVTGMDMIGQELKLKLNGNVKTKTSIGGVLTLTIFILFMLALCILVKETFIVRYSLKLKTESDFFRQDKTRMFKGDQYSKNTMIIAYPEWLDNFQKLKIYNDQNNSTEKAETIIENCPQELLDLKQIKSPTDEKLVFYCFNFNDFNLMIRSLSEHIPLEVKFFPFNGSENNQKEITKFPQKTNIYLWSQRAANLYTNSLTEENFYLLTKFEISSEKSLIINYEMKTHIKVIEKIKMIQETKVDMLFNKFTKSYIINDNDRKFGSHFYDFNLKVSISEKYKRNIIIITSIYDGLSNLGGFLYLLFFVYGNLNDFFNSFYINIFFLEKFFDFAEPDRKIKFNRSFSETNLQNLIKSNETDQIKDANCINHPSKSNFLSLKTLRESNLNFFKFLGYASVKILLKDKNLNYLKLDPKKTNSRFTSSKHIFKRYLNFDQNLQTKTNVYTIQNIIAKNKIAKLREEKEKQRQFLRNNNLFSICKFIQLTSFCCKSSGIRKGNSDLIYAFKLIEKLTDYDFVVKKLIENEIFKNLFLDSNQILSLSTLKKISKSDLIDAYKLEGMKKNKIEDILSFSKHKDQSSLMSFINFSLSLNEKEKEKIVNDYFLQLVNSDENLTDYDEIIYSNLNTDVKEEIYMRVLNENF